MTNGEAGAKGQASRFIKAQKSLHSSLQKLSKNLKKDSTARKTEFYCQARLDNLQSLRAEFRENHRTLCSFESDADVEGSYFNADVCDQFEELYLDTAAQLRELLAAAQPVPPVPPRSTSSATQSEVHVVDAPLPEIKLPTFNGAHVDWPNFKEIFVSRVHDSKSLTDLQRFYYLKSALVDEALQDVQHISMLGENYKEAWNMLTAIYDNKRVLFAHYMNVLEQLPSIQRDDAAAVKRFTQTCRSCVKSIAKLGVNVDNQNQILVYFLIKKLPQNIRKEWEHATRDQKTIPTFDALCKVLDEQYQMMITSGKQNSSSATSKSDNRSKRDTNSVHATQKADQCNLCEGEPHALYKCDKFKGMPVGDRRTTVERLKVCFNCLSQNHLSKKCHSRRNCLTCGKRHHSLLHEVDKDATKTTTLQVSVTQRDRASVTHDRKPLKGYTYEVLLPTALVTVTSARGQPILLRAFLDQGSQASFITERAAQLLDLPRRPTRITLVGLSATTVGKGNTAVDLHIGSRINQQTQYHVTAHVLPKITNPIPHRALKTDEWEFMQGLELADPDFNEPKRIDLLLGGDVYDDCLCSEVRRGDTHLPIAQQTTFGYIISGKFRVDARVAEISSFYTQMEIGSLLQKFWQLEDFPDIIVVSKENEWAEEFYTRTHQRLANGKYITRLPILAELDSSKVLGYSRSLALKRFYQLERKLDRDNGLKQAYQETIDEYLRLGQMQPVVSTEDDHEVRSNGLHHFTCCYLPHHAIIKPTSTTTKVRVVFDASAKTSNRNSLNDILAVGPRLQLDLTAILMNWRFLRYAFVADIEKMYRRIDLNEADAQYQRILWRSNANEEIKEYYCSTVMFGTASAPFTAIRTIHQLASDEERNYPKGADVLKHQMYVDDVLSGAGTINDACLLQQQIIDILKSGHFELRKWASNHPRLLESIPVEHRSLQDALHLSHEQGIQTLGMFWCPATDVLMYNIRFDPRHSTFTKRTILSTIARLFDPLGLISPIVISAKILLQKIWLLECAWDSPLPDEICSTWSAYIDDLPNFAKLSIPRWLNTDEDNRFWELHIFCDASIQAHAAAAYIRVAHSSKPCSTHLICAKSKVNSIKPLLTIPRAELCGAVLAIKLLALVQRNLRINFAHSKIFLWSDSMIVLHWIKGEPTKWKTFIANRISKILDRTSPDQWQHVQSEQNPADCATRGSTINNLLKGELWWTGPSWLSKPRTQWPRATLTDPTNLLSVEPERKLVHSLATFTPRKPFFICIDSYSSLSRVVRVTAWCLRFINNTSPSRKNHKQKGPTLQTTELRTSRNILIGVVQREMFPREWAALTMNQPLPAGSVLLSLKPMWDPDDKVLRLGGRLSESLLGKEEKHPLILPTKHHFTTLIIQHAHCSTLHGAVSLTLAFTRKQYWIINGRNAVRQFIHHCITCYRNHPRLEYQQMGNLPAVRVRPARPFSSTGVDYAGPISILPSKGRGITSLKGYIAVFICLVTKAIQLEPVGDLTAEGFIAALQRFIGRRGLCANIYSDQGTNFIGANRKLRADRRAYKTFVSERVLPFLSEHHIQWHFIPPASPHFGGLWEAGVKSMKHHLKRSIGDRKLTFEELSTVLAQIESCLNSRPLCPLTNDPNDLSILTPGHFLIGDSLLSPPTPEVENSSLTDRWKHCQFIVQSFWRQWSREYLAHLQTRPKWCKFERNLKVNDIVLLKDERLPCNRWPLGRITATHPGSDGLVRVVTVRTQNTYLKRPITKLCLLPIQDNWIPTQQTIPTEVNCT